MTFLRHEQIAASASASHLYITIGLVAIQMEMNGISAKTEGLSNVGHFELFQSHVRFKRVWFILVTQDLRTKLIAAHFIAKASLEAGLGHKLSWE